MMTLHRKYYTFLCYFFTAIALVLGSACPKVPRNFPNRAILDSWVFDNFILIFEPFAKALQIFEICVLVNNNLCRNSVSSSPIIFFSTCFLIYLVANWIFLRLKCYIESFYIILEQNKFAILSQFFAKNPSFFCFLSNEKYCCISCSN